MNDDESTHLDSRRLHAGITHRQMSREPLARVEGWTHDAPRSKHHRSENAKKRSHLDVLDEGDDFALDFRSNDVHACCAEVTLEEASAGATTNEKSRSSKRLKLHSEQTLSQLNSLNASLDRFISSLDIGIKFAQQHGTQEWQTKLNMIKLEALERSISSSISLDPLSRSSRWKWVR